MTITWETVNLDQSEFKKINSHLEIYTKNSYTKLVGSYNLWVKYYKHKLLYNIQTILPTCKYIY